VDKLVSPNEVDELRLSFFDIVETLALK